MKELTVRTYHRSQMIDITDQVQEAVREAGVGDGMVMVHIPHTTAGVTINENADPDVQRDILEALEKIVPWRADYSHGEGNAAAHVKASMMGFGVTVFVAGGKLLLGTWQAIYLCEFDGPRTRRVWVQTMRSES